MLGLRPHEDWVWHNKPEFATWWIIDGARDDVATITEALLRERARNPTHGALLAEEWGFVKNPAWTFFKTPLKPQLVYNWVEATQQRMAPAAMPFIGRKFKLRRWPNMSRYSDGLSMAQSIGLTSVCAQALKGWVSHAELLAAVGPGHSAVIESLLRDALQDEILEQAVAEEPSESSVASATSTTPTSDTKRWSLIRRLIEKFS